MSKVNFTAPNIHNNNISSKFEYFGGTNFFCRKSNGHVFFLLNWVTQIDMSTENRLKFHNEVKVYLDNEIEILSSLNNKVQCETI